MGSSQLTHIQRVVGSRVARVRLDPPCTCQQRGAALLHLQCRASLSVLCVLRYIKQYPGHPFAIKSDALPCLIYMRLCLAVLCNEYFSNIIFVVDSILANGYIGVITSNNQRIKQCYSLYSQQFFFWQSSCCLALSSGILRHR